MQTSVGRNRQRATAQARGSKVTLQRTLAPAPAHPLPSGETPMTPDDSELQRTLYTTPANSIIIYLSFSTVRQRTIVHTRVHTYLQHLPPAPAPAPLPSLPPSKPLFCYLYFLLSASHYVPTTSPICTHYFTAGP